LEIQVENLYDKPTTKVATQRPQVETPKHFGDDAAYPGPAEDEIKKGQTKVFAFNPDNICKKNS
jgi:hypothetical protein